MPKNRWNRKVRSKKLARKWLDLPPEVLSMIVMKLNAVEILTSVHTFALPGTRSASSLTCGVRSICKTTEICMIYDCCGSFMIPSILSNQQLRRLRIVVCYDISDEGLIEAVPKLPLLEHLEIFLCSNIWKSTTLRTVGHCCPLLKTLKLNKQFGREQIMVSDMEALAIAESVPKLRYLQIFGNGPTDRGLQAILDGCPDLESLDLHQCFNLSFKGQLKQKCAERIKTLHLPHDPTVGYGFITEIIDYPDYISDEYGSEDED